MSIFGIQLPFGEGKPVDAREKAVLEICEKISKSQYNSPDLGKLFTDLHPFIPDYTGVILPKVLNNVIQILSKPIKDSLLGSISGLIRKMMDKADPRRGETDPYEHLVTHPNLAPALFNNMDRLNMDLIEVVYQMYLKCPSVMTEFVKKSWQCLRPFIRAICKTGNERAAEVLHRIVTSLDEIKTAMTPELKGVMKQLPIHTAVDFMIAAKELRTAIKETEIEPWLAQQKSFHISDVQTILMYFPFMWQNPGTIKMLLKVTPFKKVSEATWINKKAAIEYEIPREDMVKAGEELAHPPPSLIISSFSANYGHNKETEGSCAGYAFLRLFILSMADPMDLSEEAVNVVANLVFDADEGVSAAAAQTILTWIVKYQWKTEHVGVVYKVAAAVFDPKKSKRYALLFKGLLRALSKEHNEAVSILSSEKELKYEENFNAQIMRANWCFPHFAPCLNNLKNYVIADYADSQTVLGYIVDMIGAGDDDLISTDM